MKAATEPLVTRSGDLETFHYDDKIVRHFLIATVAWGAIAMLAGLWLALELAAHKLNLDLPWITFGRLRPLHTNAAIFAFVGNSMFAGIYYSSQRLLKARNFSDTLSKIHFWGWQAIIVSAALTLPMGITSSKEYAELEWPIDLAIAAIWVVFAVNFFGTIAKRRERHLYVAIWFYIASIVTVALLHIVNSVALPVSLFKSYSAYAGVQDALVQWWYGHNAVAFFLTTPILGLMYYFMPKAAGRPVYSYRLSIVHFWSLIFLYIWAGPHHLLYTALPDWAQTLGMVFSVMLVAPSWGGMINGLLTLRGAWDKLRTDPVVKFFVVAITFYGMATFEGPLLSIKSVNALSHYTDWTIGHVHSGVLGWNGFFAFGMIYWLFPRLYKTKLFSTKLASAHFWLGLTGIGFYTLSMWVAGITQGLMLKELDADGALVYRNWEETIAAIIPMYWVRAVGGAMYLTGVILMIVNLIKTAGTKGDTKDEEATAPRLAPEVPPAPMTAVAGVSVPPVKGFWHDLLERRPIRFTIYTTIAVAIGGAFEIIPSMLIEKNVPTIASVKPYTPLEIEGRDIYVAEGCYTCHSQMVRPFRDETLRFGQPSEAGEFIYDRPFQWGSRRIGPDLHRVGGKYSDSWHYHHMLDPRSMSAGSIMPSYPWLFEDELDLSLLQSKMQALGKLGAPYSEQEIADAEKLAWGQALGISSKLTAQGLPDVSGKKIVALIAYLQRLGTDIKNEKPGAVPEGPADGKPAKHASLE